jgi:hypothetical protein
MGCDDKKKISNFASQRKFSYGFVNARKNRLNQLS